MSSNILNLNSSFLSSHNNLLQKNRENENKNAVKLQD